MQKNWGLRVVSIFLVFLVVPNCIFSILVFMCHAKDDPIVNAKNSGILGKDSDVTQSGILGKYWVYSDLVVFRQIQ